MRENNQIRDLLELINRADHHRSSSDIENIVIAFCKERNMDSDTAVHTAFVAGMCAIGESMMLQLGNLMQAYCSALKHGGMPADEASAVARHLSLVAARLMEITGIQVQPNKDGELEVVR